MTKTNAKNVGTFSLFDDFWKKTPGNRDADYQYIYNKVTSPDLVTQTQQLRAEKRADLVDKLKKRLPFLTVSSRYDEAATSKAAEQPLRHSGELCFDFDHLTPAEFARLRTAFAADGRTALLFTSPRGEGLKRFVTVGGITVGNHEAVYYALMLAHWHEWKALADPTCTNVNRGTFLPHDADAYLNPNAGTYAADALLAAYPDAERKMEFITRAHKHGGNPALIPADVLSWQLPTVAMRTKPAPKKAQVGTVALNGSNTAAVVTTLIQAGQYTAEDNIKALDSIVTQAEARNVSLSDSHETNIKIGWALHSIGAPAEYFHRITRLNPDYNADKMEARYANLEKLHNADRCGFGALVNIAKAHGINAAPRAAHAGRVSVSSQASKVTQMDVRDAVKALYTIYFDQGSETYYYATPGNLNPFEFAPFHAKSTFLNELLGELEGVNLFVSKSKLEETLFNRQTYTTIDYLPMQLDWLAQHYDGADHLAALLSSIKTEDSDLFGEQFTKWCVNLVAQLYGNGEKTQNENVLVLVGAQNGGKTGFFKALLWDTKNFAAPPDYDFGNKEHLLLMNGKALILLDEMAAYNKADVRTMKAALSQPKITADRKFHNTADYKRNASFAGCSNNSDFLKDDTGDRRFLVFQHVGNMDWDTYNGVDKAQLWGQLVAMYRAGFEYKFTQAEVDATIARNLGQFTMHKPEDSFIADVLEVTMNPADFLSNADMEKLLQAYIHEHHVRGVMTVSSIRAKLKLAGAQVGQSKKIAGKAVKGYTGVCRVGMGRPAAPRPAQRGTGSPFDE